MSLHDYLMKKKDYTYEQASGLCIKVENKMNMNEAEKKLYENWWHQTFIERKKNEADYY